MLKLNEAVVIPRCLLEVVARRCATVRLLLLWLRLLGRGLLGSRQEKGALGRVHELTCCGDSIGRVEQQRHGSALRLRRPTGGNHEHLLLRWLLLWRRRLDHLKRRRPRWRWLLREDELRRLRRVVGECMGRHGLLVGWWLELEHLPVDGEARQLWAHLLLRSRGERGWWRLQHHVSWRATDLLVLWLGKGRDRNVPGRWLMMRW